MPITTILLSTPYCKKLSHRSLTKLLADARSSCPLVLAFTQNRSGRSHLLCLVPCAGRAAGPCLPRAAPAAGRAWGRHSTRTLPGTASAPWVLPARARAQAWAQAQAVLIGRAKPCFWARLGSPCCDTCRQKPPRQVLEADVSRPSTHSCCTLYQEKNFG